MGLRWKSWSEAVRTWWKASCVVWSHYSTWLNSSTNFWLELAGKACISPPRQTLWRQGNSEGLPGGRVRRCEALLRPTSVRDSLTHSRMLWSPISSSAVCKVDRRLWWSPLVRCGGDHSGAEVSVQVSLAHANNAIFAPRLRTERSLSTPSPCPTRDSEYLSLRCWMHTGWLFGVGLWPWCVQEAALFSESLDLGPESSSVHSGQILRFLQL